MTSKDDTGDSAPPEVIGCEIGSVVRVGALVYLGLHPTSGATVVHSCSPAQACEFGRALVAQADATECKVMTQVHVPETRDDMARVLYERWFGMGSWDADSLTSREMRDCQLREADFVLSLIAADREQQRTAAIAPVVMHPGDAWPPKVWTVAMCPGWRGLQWTLLHPTAICDKLFRTYEDAAREAARLDASELGADAAVQRNGAVLQASDDCSVLGGW